MLLLANRRNLILFGLVFVAAHAALWLPAPAGVAGAAVLVLAGLLPGILLVEAMVGQGASRPDWWERCLYSTAAAYTIMVAGALLLSYLPGGPTQWQTVITFDVVTVGLLGWVLWRGRRAQPGAPAWSFDADWRWVAAGAAVLLVVGALLRFTNLGYTDFQGDEARAALRAAAVLQGYEDVLLLHKKGPTEILLPTLIYSATGHLNETTARLPFALANVVALFAVWLLGWRLFNPVAGWIAALFFALDGYFIGFARIVQYQSIVFLMSILVLLLLYRLVRQPRALTGYLTLAALFLATGLLSHYEGALMVLPAALLWGWLCWRERAQWRALLGATAVAALAGGALLASFYVPYVLNPRFAATYYYLTDRRIGGSPPYNNLADIFIRTTLYNTTYAVALAIGAVVAGMMRAFWRGLRRPLAIGVSIVTVLVVGATFVNPQWLLVGERDFIFVPFLLLLGLVICMPKLTVEERILWVWFTAVMLLAIFFTEKPRTHVYTFFMPWYLLVGQILALGWRALTQRAGERTGTALGIGAAGVAVTFFGYYAFQYMASSQEVLLNYATQRPPGYWVAYDEPDDKARFGFPLNNGWKVVGALYADGVLQGDFDSSEKEAWVPAWYTRGVDRCTRDAQWYFQIENLEPFTRSDRRKMEEYLRQGFVKSARVQVGGRDKMIIYQRTGEQRENPAGDPVEGLPIYHLEDYADYFDARAVPDLPLTYPAVDPPIGNPLHVNFDNRIWLEGYDIDYPQPLRPGDMIRLTLYWRAQGPMEQSYKVFNQLYANDGPMQAQRDGYPVCEDRTTDEWDPGELITDVYNIPVKAEAEDGLYPLYTGFYLEETGDRLSVLDETGNPVGSQWHVTDIRIGVE